MSGFIVALCELQPRDARLLEIVVTRAPSRRFDFKLVDSTQAGYADIAIIDADRPTTVESVKRLKADSPELVEVYVSESGSAGQGDYRIARRSLVLQCFRLLESIAGSKLNGSLGSAPMARQAAPADSTHAVAASAAATKDANPALQLDALVVDDSATVRTQLEVTLRRLGLNVTTAEDGDRAMGKLQTKGFDLIFLDVVMPGRSGYELCREIRGLPSGRHTPVVMLTSRTSPFDRARGALAGCDTYLTKPVAVKDFYAAVHKALTKRYTVDELAARGYRRQA